MSLTPQQIADVFNAGNITADDLAAFLENVAVRVAPNANVEGVLAMLGIRFGVVGSGSSGGGGGGGFDPTSIAGLKLWLAADAITGLSDGDPVATWADASGNGNDATQGSPSLRPTYVASGIGGLPSVHFNGVSGSGAYLDNTTANLVAATGDRTVILACKGDDTTGGSLFTFRRGGGTICTFQMFSNYVYSDGVSVNITNSTTTTPPSTPQVPAYRASSSSSVLDVRYNGVAQTLGSTSMSGSAGTDGFTVGNREDYGAQPWKGLIAEILVYDSALSDADRASVEGYLNAKYSIF